MMKIIKIYLFAAVSVVLISLCLITGSCIKPGTTVKDDETAKKEKVDENNIQKELIKPSLDKEKTASEDPKPEKAESSKQLESNPVPKSDKPHAGPVKTPKGKDQKTGEKEENEEAHVLEVMRDLAKSVEGITLAKLCYAKEDDEWWIMFYRDTGGKIDLKQFIWNRRLQKPEPYLVIREFSRGRLNIEMKRNEQGKECKVVKLGNE